MNIVQEIIKREVVIAIDTCSLMMENKVVKLMATMKPLLKKYRMKILVPKVVILELEKHLKCESDDLKRKAKKGIEIVWSLKKDDLLLIPGSEKEGSFADVVLLDQFSKVSMVHEITIITQDKNLANDLMILNSRKSVKHRDIRVYKINNDGNLEEHKKNWIL